MFLLASQLSTRVLDTGRELIDHELSPRLHQKIGFRSPTPKRAWSLDSLNSAASRALNQLFSSATEHLKHALRRLEGDALTSAVPWKLGLPPLYMGTFQSDLRDYSASNATQQGAKPKHLVLMVNGLFGAPENWNIVIEELQKQLDCSDVLLVASNVLGRTRTFEGIDTCGARVAEEVEGYIKEHPSLSRISVIGHSMGGLVARYLIGKLFDPETRLVAGLTPVHFITLATPHLGCDGEGLAQVPFIGWSGSLPVLGGLLRPTLHTMATPVAALMFRRTGAQFFLSDEPPGKLPLLVRMTRDVPEEGYFFSALEAFITRTAYANSSGDHLVGWANSSLRHPDELPELDPARKGRGVVREDPLEAAFASSSSPPVASRPPALPRTPSPPAPRPLSIDSRRGLTTATVPASRSTALQASEGLKVSGDRTILEVGAGCEVVPMERGAPGGLADLGESGSPEEWEEDGGLDGGLVGRASRGDAWPPASPRSLAKGLQRRPSQELEAAEKFVNSSAFHLDMLARLQRLAWRRIDTCFKGTSMPFFAHNLIQVTRVWINWEGRETCRHLASEFARLDRDPRVTAQLRPPDRPPRVPLLA